MPDGMSNFNSRIKETISTYSDEDFQLSVRMGETEHNLSLTWEGEERNLSSYPSSRTDSEAASLGTFEEHHISEIHHAN